MCPPLAFTQAVPSAGKPSLSLVCHPLVWVSPLFCLPPKDLGRGDARVALPSVRAGSGSARAVAWGTLVVGN